MSNERRFINRRQVWDFLVSAHGEKCVYCHREIATQIDHIIPYSYCAYHGIENLVPSCSWCNLLASDRVFETFDEKYEWLRNERNKKKHVRRRIAHRLMCSQCYLPYYSAMHSNYILCPHCAAVEYDKPKPTGAMWAEWLRTLVLAEFCPDAHFAMARKYQGVWNVSTTDRIAELHYQYEQRNVGKLDVLTLPQIAA